MVDGAKTAAQSRVLPEQRAMFALLRCADALATQWSRFFSPWDITLQQFNVLRVLYVRGEGEGLSCHQIASRLITRVPDITRLLDRLEKRGFVQRRRSTKDRRVVRSRLTAEGEAIVESIHDPSLEEVRAQFSSLSPRELRQLADLVNRVEQGLLACDAQPPSSQ